MNGWQTAEILAASLQRDNDDVILWVFPILRDAAERGKITVRGFRSGHAAPEVIDADQWLGLVIDPLEGQKDGEVGAHPKDILALDYDYHEVVPENRTVV